MANHKSALKRVRQNKLRQLRNRSAKTRIKNVVKAFAEKVGQNAFESASTALSAAQAVIAGSAGKGVIHRNKASRKISRLARQLNKAKAQVS